MKLSGRIKPLSYLKAHALDVFRSLSESGEPLVVTHNGEAKMVLQDIKSFERGQETMALLKVLALGNRDIEAGRIEPASDVLKRLRTKSTRV
jgi:prevent-host-death family protein